VGKNALNVITLGRCQRTESGLGIPRYCLKEHYASGDDTVVNSRRQ
jgi:hypothetical protein